MDSGGWRPKILFVANVGWFFMSHRLPLAKAAVEAGYDVHVAAALDSELDRTTVESLSRLGITFHELHLSRSGSHPLELLRDALDIWKLLGTLRPDVVHLITLKPILVAGLIAKLRGINAVVMAVPGRGSVFSARGLLASLRRGCALLAYRFAYKRGKTQVIVQNIEDRDYFATKKVFSDSDIQLIRGSGVDLREFAPVKEAGGEPVVILASRMLREKGIADFVEAAKLLREKGCRARFVLVGDPDPGNPHSHTREELDRWVASGAVEWWGFRSDMARLFAECHVFCLPTFYGEGVPKVLIEAAASGRPIVTTDMPGCRDIVRDGQNGLLVQPRNVSQLASALKRLIENPDLRVQMGSSGRELAQTEFSIDIVVKQTLEIYKSLLAS